MYHNTKHHNYDKRIGVYKITYILCHDYGIYISVPPDRFHAASTYVHNKTKIHFPHKRVIRQLCYSPALRISSKGSQPVPDK